MVECWSIVYVEIARWTSTFYAGKNAYCSSSVTADMNSCNCSSDNQPDPLLRDDGLQYIVNEYDRIILSEPSQQLNDSCERHVLCVSHRAMSCVVNGSDVVGPNDEQDIFASGLGLFAATSRANSTTLPRLHVCMAVHLKVYNLIIDADKISMVQERTKFPPNYFELCELVAFGWCQHLNGTVASEQANPGGGSGSMQLQHVNRWLLLIFMAIAFFGFTHLFSQVGRVFWKLVLQKYFSLLKLFLGVWEADNNTVHALQLVSLVDPDGDVADVESETIGSVNMHSASSAVANKLRAYQLQKLTKEILFATVASRTLILQIIPNSLVVLAVFSVMTCCYPIFVESPQLRRYLQPAYYTTKAALEMAEILESNVPTVNYRLPLDMSVSIENSSRLSLRTISDRSWRIFLRKWHIYFAESRRFQFIAWFYLFWVALGIVISGRVSLWVKSSICIVPVLLFVYDLTFIIWIGQLLGITSNDFDVFGFSPGVALAE